MLCFCFGASNDDEDMSQEPRDEYDEIPFSLKWRMHFGKAERDPVSGSHILRLSNNRLIQTHCESTEYQALKLVAKHTSIPAYKVIAVYNRPEGKVVEYEGIPGKRLDAVWPDLSSEKKRKIVSHVGRFVEQLRDIESPKREVVGDSTLGGTIDQRFGQGKIGPFYSIGAFHDFVRRGHPTKEFKHEAVLKCHDRPDQYKLKFTHANLSPRNILVDGNGQIAALLGWECAGWYPEYWEYVKMHSVISSDPKEDSSAGIREEWLGLLRNVVPRYDEELAADRALQDRFDSKCYERPRSVYPPSPTMSQLELEQLEIDDKNTENTSG